VTDLTLLQWKDEVLATNDLGLVVEEFLRSADKICWIDRHVELAHGSTSSLDDTTVVEGACAIAAALVLKWHHAIVAGLPVRASRPVLVVERDWLTRSRTPPHAIPQMTFYNDAREADLLVAPRAVRNLVEEHRLLVQWIPAFDDEPDGGAWIAMTAVDAPGWCSSNGTLWREAR
jgi:hypothetical protein